MEAANGKEFAKYWMHNGFLNIDNRKMSKSLGNFFTVREISEKYDLQVLRFFMLSATTEVRSISAPDLMESARTSLERILTAADNLRFLSKNAEECRITEERRHCSIKQTNTFRDLSVLWMMISIQQMRSLLYLNW